MTLLARATNDPLPCAILPATRTIPRLSVVIVNYRCWADTARLVRQLQSSRCVQQGDAEVVVVDNHSPAHPLLRALRRSAGVSLRRWGRNRGFGQAVNEGCRLSQGRWLLLLNPDMTVTDGFLDQALRVAEQSFDGTSSAGLVGFGLRHSDGTRQPSVGPFPTLVSTLLRMLLPRRWRKYTLHHPSARRPVAWVSGCCLLVRRACFEQLGGFDRHFFLYYEDVDLCRRAWAQGWSVWYEPALTITHHRPLHTRRVPAGLHVYTRHALLTYAAKHWPWWQFRALAEIVRLEAWVRQLQALWHGQARTACLSAALGRIAVAVAQGRTRAAQGRLRLIVQQEERRHATTAVDRHSEPPASRPAARVPRQHPAACAIGDPDRGC